MQTRVCVILFYANLQVLVANPQILVVNTRVQLVGGLGWKNKHIRRGGLKKRVNLMWVRLGKG
jgi:oligoribonuclease (3'-5' exoribonuclease)